MALEIERKFFINRLPADLDLNKYLHEEIIQGYLPFDEKHKSMRIRKKGSVYFLTVKIGTDGVRDEIEIEIIKNQFDALWPLTQGARLLKVRHYIPYNERTMELDIYQEKLVGLITADVEFDSVESSKIFTPPRWFGKDITKVKEYKNKYLAIYGLPPDFLSKKETLGQRSVEEYDLKKGLEILFSLITKERENKGDRPVFVFVAGGSASGKTSVVSLQLRHLFKDVSTLLISMDDYYRGAAFLKEQAERGVNINWDQIEAFNIKLLREHLERLRGGEFIRKPIYSFKIGESLGSIKLYPEKSQIVIFDGLFLLDDSLAHYADIRVFVDVGFHGRVLRRLFRDIHRTGQRPAEILKIFSEIVEPMHEKFIEPTKKNADLIIKNEYNPEMEAKMSGLNEIQIKFKLDKNDLENLLKRLAELNAQKYEPKFQMDYYYNPGDRDLVTTGEILRIRKENGSIILTYKGPLLDSEFRKRPKLEFEIDSDTEEKFLALYGGMVKIIEKTRSFYFLNGIIFCIDDVKKINLNGTKRLSLGKFLEIRSTDKEADEETLKEALLKLGLPLDKSSTKPYFEM